MNWLIHNVDPMVPPGCLALAYKQKKHSPARPLLVQISQINVAGKDQGDWPQNYSKFNREPKRDLCHKLNDPAYHLKIL